MLKGITRFELTDVVSGQKEVIEEHNMLTGALDDVFNNAPFGFGNGLFRRIGYVDQYATPLYSTVLGGLLLFPNALSEDENTFFAPAGNNPTGIASNDAYSGDDARRGSFNEIESGKITDSEGKVTGFRYVWDFTTSQANGQIACACLTSSNGGKGYLNGSDVYLHSNPARPVIDGYVCGFPLPNGDVGDFFGSRSKCQIIGADEFGIYIRETNNYKRFAPPIHGVSLFNLYDTPECIETLFTASNAGTFCCVNGSVWIIRNSANASGNATITIDKYAKDTWEKTTEVITVAASLAASARTTSAAYKDGYLYMRGYNNKKLVKINLSNLADVTEITLNNNYGSVIARVGHLISTVGDFVEEDGKAHATAPASVPLGLFGTWVINGAASIDSYYGTAIGATVLSPYLATINNLKNTVVKTPDKTLKVVYSVYET